MRKKEDYHREDNRPEKSRQEDCPPCRCPENDLSARHPFSRIRLFVRRRRLCWTFTNHTEQRTRMISFRFAVDRTGAPSPSFGCGSAPRKEPVSFDLIGSCNGVLILHSVPVRLAGRSQSRYVGVLSGARSDQAASCRTFSSIDRREMPYLSSNSSFVPERGSRAIPSRYTGAVEPTAVDTASPRPPSIA